MNVRKNYLIKYHNKTSLVITSDAVIENQMRLLGITSDVPTLSKHV